MSRLGHDSTTFVWLDSTRLETPVTRDSTRLEHWFQWLVTRLGLDTHDSWLDSGLVPSDSSTALIKCTKIVSVWGSAPDPAKGANLSSTTLLSRPTLALSCHPPRLFSPVTSCRSHSEFQRSACDYNIQFCAILPETCTYRRMCKCCVTYSIQIQFNSDIFTRQRWRARRTQKTWSPGGGLQEKKWVFNLIYSQRTSILPS